jgi:hypothetical protein
MLVIHRAVMFAGAGYAAPFAGAVRLIVGGELLLPLVVSTSCGLFAEASLELRRM